MALFALPALLAVASLVLAACDEEEGRPIRTPSPGFTIETIESGQSSGVHLDQPEVFKLDTPGEWAAFWDRHVRDTVPAPSVPPLDFQREMVVAVVDMEQPTGGYEIEITGIEAAGGALTVRALRTVPGAGCAAAAVITQPYHFVRTEASDLEPSLVLSTRTRPC